jgi:hypothetical protein
MELVSFPCSQQPTAGSESSPDSPKCFLKVHYNIIFPSMSRYSKWSLSFEFCEQNFAFISHLSHACYMTIHFILLDLSILVIFGANTSYKALNYVIVSSFPIFIALRSEYSPQHPVLKDLQTTFLS